MNNEYVGMMDNVVSPLTNSDQVFFVVSVNSKIKRWGSRLCLFPYLYPDRFPKLNLLIHFKKVI